MNSEEGSLTQAVLQFWTDFVKYGSVMFVIVSLASFLAGIVIFTGYSHLEHILLLTFLGCSMYISTVYVRALQDNPEARDGEKNISQLFLAIIRSPVKMFILTIYFTPLFIGTSFIGHGLIDYYGVFIGFSFIVYYPIVDFEVFRRSRFSIGGAPAVLVLTLFKSLGIIEADMSIDEIFDINPTTSLA